MGCVFELQQLLEGQVTKLCLLGSDKGGCRMALNMPWAAQRAWGQQRRSQGAVMGPVGPLCPPGVASGERLRRPAPQISPNMDRQWSPGGLAVDLMFPVCIRIAFLSD